MSKKLALIPVAVLAFALAVVPPASASTPCGKVTETGLRISGTRAYGIPCSLGVAVLRRYVLAGTPESINSIRFRWRGQRADFYCYRYDVAPGPVAKCKGGTSVGRRVPYYGTIDWRGERSVTGRASWGKTCGDVLIDDVTTTIRLIRGVSCADALRITERWAHGLPLPRPWACFSARIGEDHKLACGAEGVGNVQFYRRAFVGL